MTPRPCHGYVNGCHCPECQQRIQLIDEHRAAGRNPYTRNGKLKPLPAKPEPQQPWEIAA